MKYIDIDQQERVVVVTINRPQALNALNATMLEQIVKPLQALDNADNVGCILLTGGDRAFAAGADIGELQAHSYQSAVDCNLLAAWQGFAALRTPKIAAVSGYALGGGCELAMMCDIIYAGENAKFGQPEIKLGLIPGMGGTQRLTRLIGRSRSMDMALTGRMLDAREAERAGLVARVFANEELNALSLEQANTIANFSKTAARAAIEAINTAEECGMSAGLRFERQSYHALWATEDAREGMRAFLEKRTPIFNRQHVQSGETIE
jgi:enoyl-CoA hydratase